MAGLIFFGQTLSPLVIIALAAVLLVAFLLTMALTYGPANPPRP